MIKLNIKELNKSSKSMILQERLSFIINAFSSRFCLASSMGLEDQLLTHYLLQEDINAAIFILDTQRLNLETYQLIKKTMNVYQFKYQIYYPEPSAVDQLVAQKGEFSFYDSIENRKECCGIRKVEPLQRALSNVDAWITGLRKAQSVTRDNVAFVEQDEAHGIYKFNPLFDWRFNDVFEKVKSLSIPYNSLHDKGYPSIGCEPCTRAIQPGEDLRSGRWWWEKPEQKECGLHLVDGKLVSKKQHNNNNNNGDHDGN